MSRNVDERTGLQVLYNIANESLNPKFFHYPTFYYYITYALTQLTGGLSSVLFYGRLLNLVFGCLVGIATYLLGVQIWESRRAGLIAVVLAMFSPETVLNGSYVITDILLTLLILSSLIMFNRHYEHKEQSTWLCGCVLAGLAFSTKYTALVLFIAVVVWELLRSRAADSAVTARKDVPWLLVVGLFLVGLGFLAAWLRFPMDKLVSMLQESGGINAQVDSTDMQFFALTKKRLLILAMLVFLLIPGVLSWPRLRHVLSSKRIWGGGALLLAVFFLGTPFALVSPKLFLYDVGAELKINALSSDHGMWIFYPQSYAATESVLAFVFAVLGVVLGVSQKRPTGLLLTFLALYYLAIGSATRGFSRYLTPILPILYVLAAGGVVFGVRRLLGGRRTMEYAGLLLFLTIAAWEIAPKLRSVIAHRNMADEMLLSYHQVHALNPAWVIVAGNAPGIELRISGQQVQEVRTASFASERAFSEAVMQRPASVVLMDRETRTGMSPGVEAGLRLLWSNEQGYGQYLYQPQASHPVGN